MKLNFENLITHLWEKNSNLLDKHVKTFSYPKQLNSFLDNKHDIYNLAVNEPLEWYVLVTSINGSETYTLVNTGQLKEMVLSTSAKLPSTIYGIIEPDKIYQYKINKEPDRVEPKFVYYYGFQVGDAVVACRYINNHYDQSELHYDGKNIPHTPDGFFEGIDLTSLDKAGLIGTGAWMIKDDVLITTINQTNAKALALTLKSLFDSGIDYAWEINTDAENEFTIKITLAHQYFNLI